MSDIRSASVVLSGLLAVGLAACGGQEMATPQQVSSGAGASSVFTPTSILSATADASAGSTSSSPAWPSPASADSQASSASVSPPAASSSTAADPAAWSSWTLTTAGWGPVKLGQVVPESLQTSFEPGWECIGPMFKASGQEIVQLFVGDGELSQPVRVISLESPAISTASGLAIGDSTATMKQFYPKLVRRDSYQSTDSQARHDVFELVDGAYSMFFEAAGTTVVHISVQPSDDFYPMGQIGPCGAP